MAESEDQTVAAASSPSVEVQVTPGARPEDPITLKVTHDVALALQLGRFEGTLNTIATNVERLGQSLDAHTSDIAELRADLGVLTCTVNKIKVPIETFISLRNVLLGGAALLAAIGFLFTSLPHMFLGWFSGLFHQ